MDKYYGRDYKRESAFPNDDTVRELREVELPSVNTEPFIRSTFGVSSTVFYKAAGGAAVSLRSAEQIAKGLKRTVDELFEVRIVSAEQQFGGHAQMTRKEHATPKTDNNFHRNSKNGEFSPKIPKDINDKIDWVCSAMNMNKTKFVCRAIEKECDRLTKIAFENLRETV